ncbi:MAG: methyltransferase domain-containing protein [Bacteroidota bacterium]
MQPQKEWFSEWFDSPYYHILYKNRDMREAEYFLRNLVRRLSLQKEMKLIDLACGKGRHSIFLNSLGYEVTGVDLAAQSIAEAAKSENDRLHFDVQDLRSLPYLNEFDVALNLFTSFGYFDCDDTNKKVIAQVHKILKPEGIVVIDFMNVDVVLKGLVPHETKVVEGISFDITKRIEGGKINKRIGFTDNNKHYSFNEEVQVLTVDDFKALLTEGGFELAQVYGNYKLEAFNRDTSDRLILIARKHA